MKITFERKKLEGEKNQGYNNKKFEFAQCLLEAQKKEI